MSTQIACGDCLDLMRDIPAQSVALVLADLPYGVTACRWDKRIKLEPLWEQYLRVLDDRGVVALFAQQPFATDLINAARRMFRYEWIWDKGGATGFANAHKMPMRRHESVLVFYKRLPQYHPQGLIPCRPRTRGTEHHAEVYGRIKRDGAAQHWTGYPQSIIQFKRPSGSTACQKPTALLEYLIRTYTEPGQTVLDNVMGTGSTGVAAVATGRSFIGFELDPERFRIAERRINEAATDGTTMPAENSSRARHHHEVASLGSDRRAFGNRVRRTTRQCSDSDRSVRALGPSAGSR